MDFEFSPRSAQLQEELLAFMDSDVYPAEELYESQLAASGDPHSQPPVMEELKAAARARGLWNLFLPDATWGAGLNNTDYAPLAEIMGRSRDRLGGAATARPRTPATWSCWCCSAPRPSSANGWSRCWTARSGPASR